MGENDQDGACRATEHGLSGIVEVVRVHSACPVQYECQ